MVSRCSFWSMTILHGLTMQLFANFNLKNDKDFGDLTNLKYMFTVKIQWLQGLDRGQVEA